jgi:hypothetical protein
MLNYGAARKKIISPDDAYIRCVDKEIPPSRASANGFTEIDLRSASSAEKKMGTVPWRGPAKT